MIPADIDMHSLAGQLAGDGIAFATDNPANGPLEQHLSATLESLPAGDLGQIGFVVLEQTPAQPADLRDVAQDLATETGLGTVIVRTPQASGAASDAASRAQVERGQRAMMAQPDYGEGLRAFAGAAQGGVWNWPAVGALVLVAVAVVAAVSYLLARSQSSRKA